MAAVICNICLGSLNFKDDVVLTTSCGHIFHQPCLHQAMRTVPNCPQCRKANVRHFQLYCTVESDEAEGASGPVPSTSESNSILSRQMAQITKKIDNLTMSLNPSQGGARGSCKREVEMYRALVHQLERENQDMQEIIDMSRILSTNTEKELEELKNEVNERNDLINVLQMQNDTLREETLLYEPRRPRVPVDVLLDL